MAHPYIIRRTEISGFFGLLLLFLAFASGSHDPAVVKYRMQFTHVVDPRLLHTITVVCSVAGIALLVFAVYSQLRFGPPMSAVPRSAPWPPTSFHGWFGVVMFVVIVILMALMIIWRLLPGFKI
jgi:uncharacterized membrane protein YidH (DUF202 family)